MFAAFVYLKRQNCLSRSYKILIDQKTVLKEQKHKPKGPAGEGPSSVAAKEEGEPSQCLLWGLPAHNIPRWKRAANDHLQPDWAQAKRCVCSSSPCLKYHLGSLSHKSIIVLLGILPLFKLKKRTRSPVKKLNTLQQNSLIH